MVKIGITEVRHILNKCNLALLELHSGFVKDEVLMKVNLRDDYGLDSLDFEEMRSAVWSEYKIEMADDAMDKSSFKENPTVENFIKMINDYGYYV